MILLIICSAAVDVQVGTVGVLSEHFKAGLCLHLSPALTASFASFIGSLGPQYLRLRGHSLPCLGRFVILLEQLSGYLRLGVSLLVDVLLWAHDEQVFAV